MDKLHEAIARSQDAVDKLQRDQRMSSFAAAIQAVLDSQKEIVRVVGEMQKGTP